MKPVVRCLTLLAAFALAGCATSSDPRQGGLLGYWSTGEAGYQQRLAERRMALEQERAAAKVAAEDRTALEARKQEQAAALARLETQRTAMATELEGLEKEVGKLTGLSTEKAAERDQLVARMGTVQAQVEALKGDPAANVANQEARLAELQAEVKALRQKASLLLGQ